MTLTKEDNYIIELTELAKKGDEFACINLACEIIDRGFLRSGNVDAIELRKAEHYISKAIEVTSRKDQYKSFLEDIENIKTGRFNSENRLQRSRSKSVGSFLVSRNVQEEIKGINKGNKETDRIENKKTVELETGGEKVVKKRSKSIGGATRGVESKSFLSRLLKRGSKNCDDSPSALSQRDNAQESADEEEIQKDAKIAHKRNDLSKFDLETLNDLFAASKDFPKAAVREIKAAIEKKVVEQAHYVTDPKVDKFLNEIGKHSKRLTRSTSVPSNLGGEEKLGQLREELVKDRIKTTSPIPRPAPTNIDVER